LTGAERRQVTVFFSDVSDYTPLSEQLDPEDLRETMGLVYAAASRIVDHYGGRVDKLLGDGVLAVFGDPVAHEDDPERAIRAVLDLHAAVDGISAKVAPKIGRPITLHSGISSGVVLTGQTDAAGPLGDAVNVASRLGSIAGPGQIFIAPETYRMTSGTFDVKHLGPQQLKGKTEPIDVTEVIGIATERTRPSRVRGEFVGRQEELGVLLAAVEKLRDGEPSIISVCAEAGAGKTRLLEEFRSRLSEDVAWIEGRAYPYSQNIPYAAIIDLLNRVLGIDEGDTSETVRQKLRDGVTALVGADDDVLAPLATLYALDLPGVASIDREAYQSALVAAVRRLIDAQSLLQPSVLCLQDLHWADPSTVQLLREIAAPPIAPAVFVCNFRPEFTLGIEGERALGLDELSSRQSERLVTSLLGNADPPPELVGFIGGHTDGNPFFIEEIINRLIETEALVRSNGSWKLTQGLDRIDMPSTIRGVIQARIDHLDVDRRRLLREASVVGREFLYRVVSRVSSNTDDIDTCLSELETADLIRKKAPDPDLEYFFKHALTQEVAYEGLVRAERQELHARVADAIESMLADRTAEFVETLAFHFVRAGNTEKATYYLIESGRKSLARYALPEAQAYFAEALQLLLAAETTTETKRHLARLVVEWSLLHYYDGTIDDWLTLLRSHLPDAEQGDDPSVLSMYLGWMGNAQFIHGDMRESRENLERALRVARDARDEGAERHALAWLSFTIQEPGDLRAAIEMGKATMYPAEVVSHDPYPWFKGRGGLARAAIFAGEFGLAREISDELIAFGEETGNARAAVLGYLSRGGLLSTCFEDESALENCSVALSKVRDPSYGAFAASLTAAAAANALAFDRARAVVDEWLPRARRAGNTWAASTLAVYGGFIVALDGDYSRGVRQAMAAWEEQLRHDFMLTAMFTEFSFAGLYLTLATREGPRPAIGRLLRNPWFVATQAVPAARKARRMLDELSVQLEERGWHGGLGRVTFLSARLRQHEGDRDGVRRDLDVLHRFLDQHGLGTPKLVADFEASIS
jgi:class 3 adenylate cyclase